jgi:hypothetical protein
MPLHPRDNRFISDQNPLGLNANVQSLINAQQIGMRQAPIARTGVPPIFPPGLDEGGEDIEEDIARSMDKFGVPPPKPPIASIVDSTGAPGIMETSSPSNTSATMPVANRMAQQMGIMHDEANMRNTPLNAAAAAPPTQTVIPNQGDAISHMRNQVFNRIADNQGEDELDPNAGGAGVPTQPSPVADAAVAAASNGAVEPDVLRNTGPDTLPSNLASEDINIDVPRPINNQTGGQNVGSAGRLIRQLSSGINEEMIQPILNAILNREGGSANASLPSFAPNPFVPTAADVPVTSQQVQRPPPSIPPIPSVPESPQQTSFTSPLVPEGVRTISGAGEGEQTGIDAIISSLRLLDMTGPGRDMERLRAMGDIPLSIRKQVIARIEEMEESANVGITDVETDNTDQFTDLGV